jgi:hypothetical protein
VRLVSCVVIVPPESGAIREAEIYRHAGMTRVSCDFWSSGIT